MTSVVLLHGWGFGAAIFGDISAALSPRYSVHTLDLPGYGARAAIEAHSVDDLARDVAARAPARCAVAGWSLGAQIALAWARLAPQQVEALVLIAATPCFAQRDDWPHAVAPPVLESFTRALRSEPDATLARFASLQAQGDARAKQVAQHLRSHLARADTPSIDTLVQGLELLARTDLREEARSVAPPVLVVHGECDMLVPLAAGEYLAAQMPSARLAVVAGAAHAPFLSRSNDVIGLVQDFLDGR